MKDNKHLLNSLPFQIHENKKEFEKFIINLINEHLEKADLNHKNFLERHPDEQVSQHDYVREVNEQIWDQKQLERLRKSLMILDRLKNDTWSIAEDLGSCEVEDIITLQLLMNRWEPRT